jgi:hypothetical protein
MTKNIAHIGIRRAIPMGNNHLRALVAGTGVFGCVRGMIGWVG